MAFKQAVVVLLSLAFHFPVLTWGFFLRMSRTPLGVGVVGCGRIGQIHGNTLAFHTPGARLVAITDPFEEMGKKLIGQTGGMPTYHKDYFELLDRDDVHAVVMASPTPCHVEQIMSAVERGKHDFCEKPISNDLSAIDACTQAAAKAGTKLILGFQRRFDINFQNVKKQITQGAIGEMRTFRIVSRDQAPPPAEYLKTSGGIFLDMSSHDFDMARFLVGSEIEEVYVKGASWVPEAKAAGDLDTL
ncbi:myo-inositol 2-dehydrogenase [Nannochloropsis oceanica]